jgi:hypothetical protein
MTTATIRQYDPWAGEWRDMHVEVPDEPRRRRTRKRGPARRGMPRDLSGLSAGSPLPAWWRDTAFGLTDAGPLADMRSYIEAPAIRTHRTAVTLPADPGRITVTR